MKLIIIKITITCFVILINVVVSAIEIPNMRTLYCPYADWLVGSNFSENYRFEYANAGDNLMVTCCQKFVMKTKKYFYKRTRFFTDDEVQMRQYFDELVLIMYGISENQTGAYYCKDELATTNAFTFIYLIDIEYPNVTTTRGHVDAFDQYKKTYLDPLDTYLKSSDDPHLVKLKEKSGLGLKVEMRWDPWTECDYCKGEKWRKGRCHLRPYVIDESLCVGLCEIYKYSLQVDCRAHWTIEKLFPLLAEKAKNIPNFEAVVRCVGPCLADIVPGFNYTKKLKTRILNVGDNAILSCPGFSRKKKCYWRRDGAKLTSNEYDPLTKVGINELCMLYLSDVTSEESGNYTCYINEEMIRQNRVIVEIFYSERNKSWRRHAVYLLYVVLSCFIVLMGGIVIVWLQKENFRKISAEEMVEMYLTRRLEHERLLPP